MNANAPPIRWPLLLLMQATMALLLTASGIWLYHRHLAPQPLRIGMVDLAQIYRDKENAFTQRLADADKNAGSDQARQDALLDARRFSQQLPKVLESLSDTCDCLVLLKSSVVSPVPGTIDFTLYVTSLLEQP